MQGSGTSKTSLVGKASLPPLWGEYYPRSKEPRPRAAIIVVVVVVVVVAVVVVVVVVE